jgi:thiol-disulfide isomerase/thioredoxin
MIRTALLIVLSALSFATQVGAVLAQDAKKDDAVPALKVGDPAPALKATRWFLGDPVTKFEPGKVYIIHFWATWCPPCIGKMPELAELQARYKDKDVTVISFTCRGIRGGPDNTEEAVAAFVKKRAKALKLNYPLAYADDRTTADAWLTAAGEDGWATFLVDKAGRIAYIGSHWFLDLGLPKLLAGADAKTVGDEMAKAAAEYRTVMDALVRDFQAGRDLKPDLEALQEFEAKYPPLSDLLPVVQSASTGLGWCKPRQPARLPNPPQPTPSASAILSRLKKPLVSLTGTTCGKPAWPLDDRRDRGAGPT